MPALPKFQRPGWLPSAKQDARVFALLFPWRIALLLLASFVAATFLFQRVYLREVAAIDFIEAAFMMVSLLQLDYDGPTTKGIELFMVIVPLIGLPLIFFFGVKILNVLRVFVVREERGPAWQSALASTMRGHVLICGLGRVGYRLAVQLLEIGEPVVGIDDRLSPLAEKLRDAGMPIIEGDVRYEEVLEAGGIRRATTVVACTDKDLVNLETAFHARELNPHAGIVLRFFDDSIAETVQDRIEVNAVISRSALAAVAFAHAADGVEVVETFRLGLVTYVLARLPVEPASPLIQRTVGEVGGNGDLTVILHRRCGGVRVEPDPLAVLREGDDLFIFTSTAGLETLRSLALPETVARGEGPIVVCGLGHTGYRVVLNLLERGRKVVAADFESGRLGRRLQEEGVPVFIGDLRHAAFLAEVGVGEAAALVACTEDDMSNLEMTLKAREVNPNLRVILRFFEDELGVKVQKTFDINAVYSTSALANPAFLAATMQLHAQPVDVDGEQLFLARFTVKSLSALLDRAVADLNEEPGLTIALHARGDQVSVPPSLTTRLRVGDDFVALVSPQQLRKLVRYNRSLREVR